MTIRLPINRDNPYDAILSFNQGCKFLTPKSKSQFIVDVQSLFTELAFLGEKRAIPEDWSERFTSSVLSDILQIAYRRLEPQLLATISKVAATKFPSIYGLKVYQIRVKDPADPSQYLYWGWVKGDLVNRSQFLKEKVREEGVIELEHISPETLWVLLVYQYGWNYKYLPVMDKEKKLDDFFSDAVTEIDFKCIYLYYKYPPTPEMPAYLFDQDDPFGSIRRFAAGFSFFPPNMFKPFLKRISECFQAKAYSGQFIEIHEKDQRQILRIDLPWLLKISSLKPPEKLRLIYAIQEVAQLQFTSLLHCESKSDEPLTSSKTWLCIEPIQWVEEFPLQKRVWYSVKDDDQSFEVAGVTMNKETFKDIFLLAKRHQFTPLMEELVKQAPETLKDFVNFNMPQPKPQGWFHYLLSFIPSQEKGSSDPAKENFV